jgi:Flp pilus assembly protein TadB
MSGDPIGSLYLVSGLLGIGAWAMLMKRVSARAAVRKQVQAVVGKAAETGTGPPSGLPAWAVLPADLAASLAKVVFAGQRQSVQRWLRMGGGSALTAERFLGFKLALCAGAVIFGLALGPVPLGGLLLGAYFGADGWLRQRAIRRRQRLAAEVPNLLDLASTCLKGGMTVHAVLNLAAEVWRPGPLRDELQTVRRELNLHQPLERVLGDLAARTACEELAACVQAFCQGSHLGVPVAEATRAQAAILRHQRVERAKDLAHKAEAKITLVSTLLAMPTTFLFVAGSLLYAMFSRPAVFGFQWFRP